MTNKVELSGRVYNADAKMTSSGKTVVRFGLSIWAGKDKEGKNTYQFVNCKYWGVGIQNNAQVEVVGKIAFDVWEKDGKQNVRPYILVDSFKDPNKPEQQDDLGGI